MHLAAAADIHYTKTSQGALRRWFGEAATRTDVLLLCGDLTDYGLAEEAHVLADDLRQLKVPTVAVLGNHDHESDQADGVARVLCDAGVFVLDGDATEIDGVGFVGAKGFGGGFGRRALGPWGERSIKAFVGEVVDEAMKIERALARLKTDRRVVLLHYSPVRETVEGEPLEIYPFLGSSRLEEPINRFGATVVFHGHAHAGAPEARTAAGIPVYNVALPVLRRYFPGAPPFRIVEI